MYQLLIGSIQWAITILQTRLFQFWSVDLFWQWAFRLHVQIVHVCLAC
jgi:hypothetical protein